MKTMTGLVITFLIVSVLPLIAQFPSNTQRAYEGFLAWRSAYDADKDYGLTKKEGDYPRLLNNPYYVPVTDLDTAWLYKGKTVNVMDSIALALSRWDVVSGEFNRESSITNIRRKMKFHVKIKEYNPDVKLFLYLLLGVHPPNMPRWKLLEHHVANTLRENRWFFYDTNDSIFPMWNKRGKVSGLYSGLPNYRNPTCASFIAGLVDSLFTEGDKHYDGGDLYDGLWIDLLRGHAEMTRWLRINGSDLDMNNNGINDTLDYGFEETIDSLQVSYVILLDSLRGRLGKDKIIYGNPGTPWGVPGGWKQDSILYANFNGNEIQGTLPLDYWIEWGVRGAIYNQERANPYPQRLFAMDYLTEKTCCCPDTAKKQVRYTLTAALMTEAYYTYNPGGLFRECRPQRNFYQTLWWPEYNCNLGTAKSGLTVTTTSAGDTYFSRDFEYGKVIVNNNVKAITIRLKKRMQDVTSGEKVKTITVPTRDGRVLLYVKPWYRRMFMKR